MNIFELMWFLFVVASAIVGATFGFSRWGVWGLVLGIPVGGALGFGAAFLGTLLLALLCKAFCGGTIFPPRPPSDGRTSDAQSLDD